MAEKIIPVGNRIMIKLRPKKEMYGNTGIYIPDAAQIEELVGTVMGIGEEVTEIKIGDEIRFNEFATPMPIDSEGTEHLILRKEDIVAKIVNV